MNALNLAARYALLAAAVVFLCGFFVALLLEAASK